MGKRELVFWRLAATLITFLWIIVFFAFNPYTSKIDYNNVLFDNSIFYILSACISFILIIFPTKFLLYILLCYFWGLLWLFEGESLSGFLIYALGCVFSHKKTSLFNNRFILMLVFILPFIMLSFQYRMGIESLVISIIEFIFLLVGGVLFVALNYNEKISFKNNKLIHINDIKVDLGCLTEEEILLLQSVLQFKTYQTIGKELNKSESSIKQAMVHVYQKIGITCKKDLLELQKNNLLIFPI